jgi:hypothetical protein
VIGIATQFFFPTGVVSISLMVVGCVVASLLTEALRRYVPFMTYATPFNLTFWRIYFLGPALGVPRVEFAEPVTASLVEAVGFGVGQVLFQASIWTTLFFLAGMVLNNWKHSCCRPGWSRRSCCSKAGCSGRGRRRRADQSAPPLTIETPHGPMQMAVASRPDPSGGALCEDETSVGELSLGSLTGTAQNAARGT